MEEENSIAAANFVKQYAPAEMDYEEHVLSLSTANIQANASLYHKDVDRSEEEIPTKMIQICINTLNSDHITPEEQALGHFNRNKLKKLSTWNEWKEGKVKQIEQFMNQKVFGDPIDPIALPETAIIIQPHWQ